MMTDYEARVEAVLRDSEDKLIELLAEAGEARDYDSIEMIRTVARELDDIASSVSEWRDFASPRASEDPLMASPAAAVGKKRGRYPRFMVNGKALEKIGWSPKRRAEYSHRIPRAEFNAVVQALATFAQRSDAAVNSDEILDAVGERVKHYQVYGVLRFLRSTGVIAPAARGEYSVPSDIMSQAEEAWRKLETL